MSASVHNVDCRSLTWRDAVLCYLDGLTPTGPGWFEFFAQLLVPLLAVIASGIIAYASLQTSRRAVAIAEAATLAERDRGTREEARAAALVDRDYAVRLDRALVQLIETLGVYAADARDWSLAAGVVDEEYFGDPEYTPYPPLPSTALLDAHLEAAKLLSRGNDRLTLGRVDAYVRALLGSSARWKAGSRVKFLVHLIRKWRDESISDRTFEDRLERKRKIIVKELDEPPPLSG